MKASICLSTHNRPNVLERTLESIFQQSPPFDYEVIVVDDGPADNASQEVCQRFTVQYHRIVRDASWLNPSHARNVAYKHAVGEVVICQSDDVLHVGDNCIDRLVNDLTAGHFLIANVFNVSDAGEKMPHNVGNPGYSRLTVYTGPTNLRPFFFLGSLFREDLCRVGGNDEEFVAPGYDDDWFAACLINGASLQPIFSTEVVGHHLHHVHHFNHTNYLPSKHLYRTKCNNAKQGIVPWIASGGSWAYVPDVSVANLS